MILADTSLWIDHFRNKHLGFGQVLQEGHVVCHPFVVGELACGNLHNRNRVLELLGHLPQICVADDLEVMTLLNTQHLFGRGLGWVDMHILAACLLGKAELWTLDKSLKTIAAAVGVSVR